MKVDQLCVTPRCVADIEKYGDRYHGMHALLGAAPSFLPTASVRCERCGGYYDGEVVKHTCVHCGIDVAPGDLVGLFVPHACKACQDKIRERQRSTGMVCRGCGNVHAECYC